MARLVAVVGVALLVGAARPAEAAVEPTNAGVSTYVDEMDEIIWMIELLIEEDIDGDGIIGPPPPTP